MAMRAIRLKSFRAPLVDDDVPVPVPGPRDVLVRVRAAGICGTDAHYRAGHSHMPHLPVTLGHEVAGTVEEAGSEVTHVERDDRVCLHYLAHYPGCDRCGTGEERFCPEAEMMGKRRDGGYAEFVSMPGPSAVPLPDPIPFERAAVMMCSSVTALHALRKARLSEGESVAIFGAGGLGISAVQIARSLGASQVFAVDVRNEKLGAAARHGAIPVDASKGEAVAGILEARKGGVDVALDLVGSPATRMDAVRALGPLGRAVMVGLGDAPLEIDIYREVMGKEAEIIGSCDHTLAEIHEVIGMARAGNLDLADAVANRVSLGALAVNGVLDALDQNRAPVRTVIVP